MDLSKINITVELGAASLAAINNLAAAIASTVGGKSVQVVDGAAAGTVEAVKTVAEKTAKKETQEAAPQEPIYWFSSATNASGVVDSEDEYKALKKADAKVVKITKSKYESHVAAQDAAAAEEANAAEAVDEQEEHEIPSEQDVIDTFHQFINKSLPADVFAQNRAFAKALLDRFGAPKATALAEKDRRLAINIVQRKLAGEDVDPETATYAEIDEDLV